MHFAFMPLEAAFVSEAWSFARRVIADVGTKVLVLMFPIVL
jgi:hypothetical protein